MHDRVVAILVSSFKNERVYAGIGEHGHTLCSHINTLEIRGEREEEEEPAVEDRVQM